MATPRTHDCKHTMGAGGHCVCPKCAARIDHRDGVRCQDERCPECGAKMLREGSDHHQKFLAKQAERAAAQED